MNPATAMATERWLKSQPATVSAGMACAIHVDPAGSLRTLAPRLARAAANGAARLLAECAACPPNIASMLRATTLAGEAPDWPSPARLGRGQRGTTRTTPAPVSLKPVRRTTKKAAALARRARVVGAERLATQTATGQAAPRAAQQACVVEARATRTTRRAPAAPASPAAQDMASATPAAAGAATPARRQQLSHAASNAKYLECNEQFVYHETQVGLLGKQQKESLIHTIPFSKRGTVLIIQRLLGRMPSAFQQPVCAATMPCTSWPSSPPPPRNFVSRRRR